MAVRVKELAGGGKSFRISKEALGLFPSEVATAIKHIASDYRIATVSVYTETPGAYSVMEGERVTAIRGGQSTSVEMVTQDTIGARGVSYQIGSKIETRPGDWLICTQYFLGKYYMDVRNYGSRALA